MQFATQSQAETHGYLPDFSGLAYIDTDSLSLSLDTSDHAWDSSLTAAFEYAALAGALASGSMVIPPAPSLGPTIAPHAHLGYDTGPSYVSGFDHHVTAQFPGVSCASTPEEDLLWGNCDTNLSAEAPVNIDSLNSLTVTSPSLLTAARPAIDPLQALDPAELWQGYYDSAHAFAPYESAYLSSSSQSPTNSSPASDWAGIFSPAASPETTASSSIVPSPEPTTFAPSPPASANRQSRKATPHVGRVRSSASRHTKPYPSIPSFANRCARSTASRNKQIPADEITESVCRGGMEFCSNCSYQTRRKGDMRRHMKTHSGTTEYICCGVPVKDIPGYVGKTRYHEGREMAGGCLKAFRRKDSFLRHLKVSGGTCIRPTCLGSS